jgi:hypothetical protein
VAGLKNEWLIVAGIESTQQKKLAREARFGFAQGNAMRAPYEPPATKTDPISLPRRRLADLMLD